MQTQLKLVWWSQDSAVWYTWRHIDTISRPTEDAAFMNIETAARRFRNSDGRTILDDFEYTVWQWERRVIARPRPEGELYDSIEIVSEEMGRPYMEILNAIDMIEAVFENRATMGLDSHPPKPPKPHHDWRRATVH